jgi:CxxC-x17-CxxC domain-containing protein
MEEYRMPFNKRFEGRGGGRGGHKEMHDAVCTECGQKTKVPFNPTPGRDVFCQECWNKRRNF